MNRLTFLFILIIYTTCIYGFELNEYFDENSLATGVKTNLLDIEGRRRKKGHYFLYPLYGWHALSWIYWVKVKLIVVAFFVGTAFIWGIQYFGKYYQKCSDAEHIHYGQYRSLDEPQISKFLQNLKQSHKKRALQNSNL